MSKYNIGTANASVQPKLSYRFKVEFVGLGGAATDNAAITGYVNSFTPASFSQEPVTIDAYVSRYYVLGKHTIGTLSIEFRNDANNQVASLIQKQIDRQYNAEKMSHAANAGSVKFITKLLYLDGTDDVTGPNVLEGYIYTGCWITETSPGQSSYADSNPNIISVTMQPDNMFHIVSGLSKADSLTLDKATAVGEPVVLSSTGNSAT